jgi:pilus assembly protein Flp/PilA
MHVKSLLIDLLKDESGQDLIEYALVAGIIALGAVTAMGTLANDIGNAFNTLGNRVTNAAGS